MYTCNRNNLLHPLNSGLIYLTDIRQRNTPFNLNYVRPNFLNERNFSQQRFGENDFKSQPVNVRRWGDKRACVYGTRYLSGEF